MGNGEWDVARLRELLVEVLSLDHSVEDFEVERAFPAIGRKSMLLNARRFPPESKNPELILLAIEDVTERRRAEATLRESHARIEALFDAAPIGMYLVDSELRIRLVSRAARPVFGDIGELIGREFVDVIHILWPPASADEIVARFRHMLATGEPFIAPEFSELRHDRGVREYYEWQIHCIVLPDGRHGVVCYFTDISARVIAEQALHESEVRYRRLFETAKDGILILDTHSGRITDANPFMSELLGYSHGDFLGKELWEIGLFSDKSANEAAVRELQGNGYIRYEHLPLESVRERTVEVEVVANVYREDHQSVIQCNIRDITERSRLERQMREQTAALAELHRRKDEFLAMLSHELRNPLAPIANAVQLLRLQTLGASGSLQAAPPFMNRGSRPSGMPTRKISEIPDRASIRRNSCEFRYPRRAASFR